ncbi:hypothetical protein L6452_44085 [Arctium lappa]|uniref:Uncharacterized protein n=1 Tax=Arctium lappa TaxID=4217 RepID=A0ACB8XEN5_ARCLA|nr:hypothetical protein L6452_44085 [Arctium lappa]
MDNTVESTSTLVSKVPMLKPNEFDKWKIRIKQYILLTDFSMWDIVENGPSAEGKIGQDGRRPPPKSDAEKKVRQLEMKALSTLLLAIPNEYQHQFHHCTDAQILWNALEKRFVGTKSTKRNQRDILIQQYENFTSSKNESMTQTFDRFNKLIGELATIGVQMKQDDVNRKFLRSLGDEWTMYTVSFKQNDMLEEKELDDLYNDLRVFESEVEAKNKPTGYVHNAALLSASTDSTANPESVNAASGVNQEKGNESVFEAFLSSHGNSSLINDDLEQLHPDDLEEMDIKWQMSMLSMRVKKFIKRTGRNNFSQRREDGAGFDKSKVECYKCHMKGHFARECRSGMYQNNHQQAQTGSFNPNRNSAQALVSQQGMGFDWSDQAEEVIQNQALMAEVSDLPTEVLSNLCSQTCIDTVKRYRDHNQSMSNDLKRLEKDRKDYVKIVERFEKQIKGFQANELQHTYDTNYWKWEKNDLEIQLTKSREENEKLRGELDKVKLDVEKFSYASKAMDSMLKVQIHDKLKPGIGYNTTPPPYNNNYIPPKSDLLETKDRKDLHEEATKIDPLDEVVVENKTEKEAGKSKDNTVSSEIPLENNILTNEGGGRDWVKSEGVKKTEGKSEKVHYKQTTVVNPVPCKQCAGNKFEPLNHDKMRGNQRNWNNQWAQKQGVDLSRIIRPKPCFICSKFNHLAKHCYFNPINQRINFQRSMQKPFGYRKNERNHVAKKHVKSKSHMKKKTVTESVKMWVPKSTKTVSTATINSAADKDSVARSNTTAINVSAAESISTSSNVNTANSVSASNKVSTAKPVSAANSGNQQLKEKSIWHIDSGFSRHMTGNMACLKNFKKIDGRHVAFGNTPDGGKISGKGDVTKGKMTFEDIFYVEQLRYNLLSVSQVCDKKHSILFTDSECMILAPGFKVVDEKMILLRTPRKDNVYCLDMKNVSNDSSLNCLVSKASLDESSLWHRRMCHMNFTTMNKLVKNNLVRGLPSKVFSCDDHCVACLKGKRYKTSHKSKKLNTISSSLQLLHMDLLGPTNVMSIGIERQYSAPRTPQQNGVAERRNRTLIEAARSLLADSKLPITLWAEAVNTACYVQNRVLVVKPKNKTPYELLNKRKPFIGFFKPFGCPCTILNTKTHLGKFDSKADDGFLVGYSSQSKAYRVFNSSSRIIEESDNVKCNENTPNPISSGPQWLFDINSLTNSLGFSSDDHAGSGSRGSGDEQVQDITPHSVIFPIPTMDPVEICEKETVTEPSQSEEERRDEDNSEHEELEVANEIPSADLNDSNLDVGINEEPIHQTRTQKNHPPELVIGDITSPMITRNQSRLQDLQDQQHTVLSCFLSHIEPKKAYDAMKDSSWIEAMQEELLQFKLQDVWDLVDLPKVARVEAIRLFLAYASFMQFKVYQMDVNSAFLYGSIDEEVYVCQPPRFENPSYPDRVYKLKKALYGLHQAPRAWYDTLSTYLLENRFERGIIDKTLFIKRQKKGILLVQIYVDDIIFRSSKDQMCRDFEELMHKSFKMSSMGEITFFLGIQVKQQKDGIFISQSKYVKDILNKYGLSDSKPASTPMETHKQITADLEGEDVDVHLYRSMIGSLMYLATLRPDIMFPVCVCARFQVKTKQSHLQAAKRIFRYLRGQPRLGLWYPYESTFDLIAYSGSDLGGANMDRKSTSGGCQLLGTRLVSWQCKKQTTVSLSTTEAEYIAAASCCSQVLWIQNQMLDYGVTFLHTPIFIDNSSVISIVNNPVKHSKTKHIEISPVSSRPMASMAFIDEHNEIGMLQKPQQATGFHQIVDFLKSSHIAYALTVSPTIFIEHQKQFWANATAVTENGVQVIKTRVCDKPLIVTEEVIRISLRLDDASGITSIPNENLFSNLTRMGYEGQQGVFKFYKANFSSQWRFFVHTLMHCISRKTTGWSQFSSTIAYALVCLSTARKYNFSKMIFNDLVSNLENKKSFYMYPRFVQAVITTELTDIPQFNEVYVPKIPKGKVFSNMKRSAKDSEGVDTPLFSTMMVVSHNQEGMASGSRPSLDHPIESQTQPSTTISLPQSLVHMPTPVLTKTYAKRKVHKAPSLVVPPTNPEPQSPLMEHSPLENINRETTGVSPNPKEVLTEEMYEHVGEKVATTPASTEEDSGNIIRPSPWQLWKTSTTKSSNDPSKWGNTPREGEDRYDYHELISAMSKMATKLDSQKQVVNELKKVIINQQEEISSLKKLVQKVVQKKKKQRFVLRQRKPVDDAPKKGESEAEINLEREIHGVEGEFDVKAVEKDTVFEEVAVTDKAAETVSAAETNEAAEIVQEVLSDLISRNLEEIEIAEALIKAKHDTPKVTSKAKGVVIKEKGEVIKKASVEKVANKDKGKAKIVESDQPLKKQKLIESDEALAKKIQEELEQAESVQVEKDREMAKALAAELNEVYQQRLATEIAQKKAATLKKHVMIKMAAKKRQPSKTYLGTQERKKMITFLKGVVGVKKEMFSKMSFEQIKGLYDAEMTKLQGNDQARVEVEKRMKERHDLLIEKPFPDDQETPKKEATLGESLKTLKRTKMMARRKLVKKSRVAEEEAEQKVAEEEGAPKSEEKKAQS